MLCVTPKQCCCTPPCITISQPNKRARKQRQATSYNISITYQISCWICFIQFTPSCPLFCYLLFCINCSGIFYLFFDFYNNNSTRYEKMKTTTSSLHTHTKYFCWNFEAYWHGSSSNQYCLVKVWLEYFSSQSLHNNKKKNERMSEKM